MVAIEMRNLATAAPEIAPQLRHIANQLEAEAAEILAVLGK